jgi:hypothetical protein
MKSIVSFTRKRKALGHGIDGEYAAGAEEEGAADRELPDRTAPQIAAVSPPFKLQNSAAL